MSKSSPLENQDVEALKHQVIQLEDQVDDLQRRYDDIVTSTSWKITAPVRSILKASRALHTVSSGVARVFLGSPKPNNVAAPQIEAPADNLNNEFNPSKALVSDKDAQYIFLDFEWSQTARPCDVTDTSDSRSIAVGMSKITVKDADSEEVVETISFQSGGNATAHVCYGFSEMEHWGAWSNGGRSSIILQIPKHVEMCNISFEAGVYEEAFETVSAKVYANNTYVDDVSFGNGSPDTLNLYVSDVSLNLGRSDLNLSLVEDAEPEVSIIILDFNKPGITLASAMSAMQAKTKHSYEIIVLENGSSLANVEKLRAMDLPIRLIALNANRFFGEGNNIAAEFARGKYVLFLNNDAFLSDGVIDKFHAALQDPDVGAVGPLFRYPDGRVQEAGAYIKKDGSAYQRGKNIPDFDPAKLPSLVKADYISAACVMVSRDDFYSLGGFDLRYDPAYYEDSDLCLRLNAAGKDTMLARDAEVIHIENATTSDPKNKKLTTNIVSRHKKIFLSRWSEWLAEREPENLPDLASFDPKVLEEALELRWSDKPANAVFSPFPVTHGGGERYLLGAASAIAKDMPTCLVTPDEYSVLRLATLMHELGYPQQGLFTDVEKRWKARKTPISVLMGNELLPTQPSHGEKRYYHCQFPFPQQLPPQLLEEHKNNMKKFSAVVLNSEFTRDAYARAAADMNVKTPGLHVIPPPVKLVDMDGDVPEKEKIILTIGRFHPDGHSKRQDITLQGFIRAQNSDPAFKDWRLIMCGMVPNEQPAIEYYEKLRREVEGTSASLVLAPSREKIQDYLRRASIYISATGFGKRSPKDDHNCEHFGITVAEAASAGCIPIVYDRGGPVEIVSGFGVDLTFGRISELATRMSEARELAQDTGLREKIISGMSRYSEENFMRAWRELTGVK